MQGQSPFDFSLGRRVKTQFLRPTITILKKLQQIAWRLELLLVQERFMPVYSVEFCAEFDLVAKAPALNVKQGCIGCSACLHPRVHSGRCMTYPPDMHPPRIHASVLADARKAECSNAVSNGIFGRSILSSYLDIVDAVLVDCMHCVLEGVTKWLLLNSVNSRNNRQRFYLGINTLWNSDPHTSSQDHPIVWPSTSVTGRDLRILCLAIVLFTPSSL